MSLSAANIAARFAQVKSIIDRTEAQPVGNPDSRFVVVTYWWGRGNLNKNTSRPCIGFYEELFEKPIIRLSKLPKHTSYRALMPKDKVFAKHVGKYLGGYMNDVSAYTGTTRDGFVPFGSLKDLTEYALPMILDFADQAVPHIHTLFDLAVERTRLEDSFSEMNPDDVTLDDKQRFKADIEALIARKEATKAQIKTLIRPFANQMWERMTYQPPLRYEEMIAKWEAACKAANCSYMAVEYPEFAMPGGYQLAINAKPRFIQKALELSGGRGVLYIDGDMTVNRYPAIFDLQDVDMMARGWHIDPRSSYMHNENMADEPSITVDPYNFETSGGTMFFGTTVESKALLERWIEVSETPMQFGKADDRLLSLVFNTRRMLLPMKIIQLPVEYLWLTLDYKDSVLPQFRDRDQLFLEHPECLTSEDTAADRGASSSRTPVFYEALGDAYPRSEFLMERVMFDTPGQVRAFEQYLAYLDQATYFSDMEDEGLAGEQPFYVVPYEKGFGKFQAIVEANTRRAASLPPLMVNVGEILTVSPNAESMENTLARVRSTVAKANAPRPELRGGASGYDDPDLIARILQALDAGISVEYRPQHVLGNDMNRFEKARERYPRIEFMFFNKATDNKSIFYYQAEVDVASPIYFGAGCRHLRDLVSMCRTIRDLEHLYKNAYQFLSRIRTHYIDPSRFLERMVKEGYLSQNALNMARGRMVGGVNGSNVSEFLGREKESEEALNFLYGTQVAQMGGRRVGKKRQTRRRRSLIRRRKMTHRRRKMTRRR